MTRHTIERATRVIWPFTDLGLDDVAVAGGKGANLGELTRAGLSVPKGFVLGAPAYLDAMTRAGVRRALHDGVLAASADDVPELHELAAHLRETVRQAAVPDDVRTAILDAYHALGSACVAVRSSATSEDAAGTSFAGMHRTFTNVSGDDDLVARVLDCWESLYEDRVVAYRATCGMREEPAIAVVVQEMVDADRSGIAFTAEPTSGDRSRVIIEAAFGLGEVVAGGQLEPDTYVVARDGLALLEVHVGSKTFEIHRGTAGDERVELPPTTAASPVLTDEQVREIAQLAPRVEEHYGSPQDVEWTLADGRLSLVQARPITTLPDAPSVRQEPAERGADVVVAGLGASPGVVAGPVRVLHGVEEGDRLEAGEILVAPMTTPDWVPTLRRAAALVTDGGGITCHAAIVARELRVPCVVGARPRPTSRWRSRHRRRSRPSVPRRSRRASM